MVTTTNHAIDSLMEGLLDAGVATQPGQMIRVGGRSRSERLESHNLKNVSEEAEGGEGRSSVTIAIAGLEQGLCTPQGGQVAGYGSGSM